MAENEAYRVDIVIDVSGDEQAKGKLKAMDKFMESTRRRAKMLDKVRISPAARLIDKISGPAKKIQSVLSSMAKRTWSVTIRAKDMVTGTIKKIFNAITSPLGLIGIGVSGAAAFQGLVRAPLELAGNMEQARIGFETMLGSAEKATAFLRDLQAFAAKTPFEFPQLQESSQLLLAFGFGAEQILPMMTAIGNAMAGLGKGPEGIERAVTAIGQMRAKGKVSAEEIMQLTELGIPAYDIIQKKFKLTADQMDNIGKAGLNVNKVISAIIEGMNQRFPNMMDRQSRSLLGLWSTIKDTFNMSILYRWGDGLSKAIKPKLEKLVDYFTRNEDVTKRWGDTLERVAREAGTYIMDTIEGAFNKINNIINDPKFKEADLSGKIKIVWEEVIVKPFDNWWQSGGRDWAKNIGIELGTAIGNGILSVVKQSLASVGTSTMEFIANPNKETASNVAKRAGTVIGAGALLFPGVTLPILKWGGKGLINIVKGITSGALISNLLKLPSTISKGVSAAPTVLKGGIAIGGQLLSNLAVTAGKVSPWLYGLQSTAQIITAQNKSRELIRQGVGAAGYAGGTLAGAKLGAAIGTMFAPGAGTAIGALGGAVGGWLSGSLGRKIGSSIYDWFSKQASNKTISPRTMTIYNEMDYLKSRHLKTYNDYPKGPVGVQIEGVPAVKVAYKDLPKVEPKITINMTVNGTSDPETVANIAANKVAKRVKNILINFA